MVLNLAHFEKWTINALGVLKYFVMLYWRRMETFSLTDRVKNEVLQRDKKERNILHAIKLSNLS